MNKFTADGLVFPKFPDKYVMSSEAKKLNKRRSMGRYFVTKVPACFILKAENDIVFFRVTNVSDAGLGIESQIELDLNAEVLLITMAEKINLKVSWVEIKDDTSSNFKYSAGLELVDTDSELRHIFNAFNTEEVPND